MRLDPASAPDWDEVGELIEAAWRYRSPKRAQRLLDAQQLLDQQRSEG